MDEIQAHTTGKLRDEESSDYASSDDVVESQDERDDQDDYDDEERHAHHTKGEVKTLLSWHAPGRPFRKRKKEYFINSAVIALTVEFILFLFAQHLLMVVVLSLVFVAFALALVPPHDFYFKISTEGITIEDHFFLWQELYDFYFVKTEGVDVLHLRTKAYFPGELTVTLGDMDREHIKSILLPFLPYREYVKPTFIERSGEWLARNFPLEKP